MTGVSWNSSMVCRAPYGGDGGLHGGGVAQSGVAVAGGESGGDDAADPGAGLRRAGVGIQAVVFRHQPPGQVHLRAGDVAMYVHAAGHDGHALSVDDPGRRGRRGRRHAPVFYANVFDFAVNAVGGVIDSAAGDQRAVRHAGAAAFASAFAPSACPRARVSSRARFLIALRISSSVGKGDSKALRRVIGTSSMR